MKTIRQIISIVCLIVALPVLASANEMSEHNKITMLISKIDQVNGVFLRNGKEHSATEAAEHIRKKRDYAGDRIKTARQFVDMLASRSYFSGKPYYIQFNDGSVKTTRYWLLLELHRMEEGYYTL